MPKLKKSTFEERCELIDRTIEAILLGFNEPLHPLDKEYVIPSPRRIQEFVRKAIRDTKLQKRVEEGWERITRREVTGGPEQSANRLEDYMIDFTSDNLDWRFFPNYGDLYKFKEGEREKAKERVKSYWAKSEIKNFLKINAMVQEIAIKHYKER